MKPSELIRAKIKYELTPDQDDLLALLDDFLLLRQQPRHTFILKGYAGTGKTTIISQLVQIASQISYKVVLLAPTGRAAKVLANYSLKKASTIHRKIYKQTDNNAAAKLSFQRIRNLHTDTIFIVDEASMLSDKADYGSKSLLSDLIGYVFENPTNKLILVGDTAQLPPVGDPLSPALNESYLEGNYNLEVSSKQLTQVMRQAESSGILFNATNLRQDITENNGKILMRTRGFKDFYKMTAERLEDGLRYAYEKYGIEETVVICRSNKNANNFNQYIRRVIRYSENEVESGDLLMIVKNNYFVLGEQAEFLANGDFAKIIRMRNIEEFAGLRFATMTLQLLDSPIKIQFEAKVMLDTLYTPHPSLPQDLYQKLYEEVLKTYADITQKNKRNEALRQDPYLNALQVKFAYALTCHKSQGGQWKAVFVEQGYLNEEMVDLEFLRWLYTAVTRSEQETFMVNFRQEFFEET